MKIFKLFILLPLFITVSCITITEQMFLMPSKEVNSVIPISQNFIRNPVKFQSADGLTLDGLYLNSKSDSKAIIILLRGNFGNMFSDEWVDVYNSFSELDVDLFTFDYRGFGRSEGNASIDGILRDSESAIEYFIKSYKTETPIFLYGLSLGSLPAVRLAQNENIDGLIMEGAFSSAKDVAKYYQRKYWFVKFRVDENLEFDSVKEIKNFSKPLLILIDGDDKALPKEMSQKLYSNAGSFAKEFVNFENSGHCEASIKELELFQSVINKFINKQTQIRQNVQ